MISRRNALLTIGVALPLAGCTDTSDTDEENQNRKTNSSESVSETSGDRTDNEASSTEESAEISILNVTTPESITKGSEFETTAIINTDANITITTEATDKSGNIIAQKTTQVNGTGEQAITMSGSVSRAADLGNGSVQVRVTNGPVTERFSSKVIVTADWQEAFSDAKDNLEQFLFEFAAMSPEANPTILDTTISVDYTNGSRGLLTEADNFCSEALDGVPSSNNSFRNKIQRLRFEIGAARKMSLLQEEISSIFSNNRKSDPYPRIEPDRIDEQESQRNEFFSTVSDFNPIVGSRYEAKAEQFESELSNMDEILTGIRKVGSARGLLDDGNYDAASTYSKEAESIFTAIKQNLNKPESYPPIDRVDESFIEYVEEWESEANDVQLIAAAGQASDE